MYETEIIIVCVIGAIVMAVSNLLLNYKRYKEG